MVSEVVARYRTRFRALLRQVQPKRLDHGVDVLVAKARRLASDEGLRLEQALQRIERTARQRVANMMRRAAASRCSIRHGASDPQPEAAPSQSAPPATPDPAQADRPGRRGRESVASQAQAGDEHDPS